MSRIPLLAALAGMLCAHAADSGVKATDLVRTEIAPVRVEKTAAGVRVDFGKAWYGTLRLIPPVGAKFVATNLVVHVGEKLAADGSIDRKPPGSVIYRRLDYAFPSGGLVIPEVKRHQDKAAVHMPPEIGEVTVFRAAEIENPPFEVTPDRVRLIAVHAPFDDAASAFSSSDETLNVLFDLCKHTMKATTAFGVYIDGERERIPYEADAYLNQLSHYAVQADFATARRTLDHFFAHPTWPTEWAAHMIFMAAEDYRHTGDKARVAAVYEKLKPKLLQDKARADGLLQAYAIVDWPPAERDGFGDGTKDPNQRNQTGPAVNSVVNAFYLRALAEMALMADALGKAEEARAYRETRAKVLARFNEAFWDKARGVYVDGEKATHASLHANLFPLAFGLVPADRVKSVADFVESRGMACSVYAAQYLMEGLFRAGRGEAAMKLLTSRGKRSWWNMHAIGSTMTLEAWDPQFKPNLTWNHAWGATPGNLIPRFVGGIEVGDDGSWTIKPRPDLVRELDITVPTRAGGIRVKWDEKGCAVTVPAGLRAAGGLPGQPVKPLAAGTTRL